MFDNLDINTNTGGGKKKILMVGGVVVVVIVGLLISSKKNQPEIQGMTETMGNQTGQRVYIPTTSYNVHTNYGSQDTITNYQPTINEPTKKIDLDNEKKYLNGLIEKGTKEGNKGIISWAISQGKTLGLDIGTNDNPTPTKPVDLDNEKKYLQNRLEIAKKTNNTGLESWINNQSKQLGITIGTPTSPVVNVPPQQPTTNTDGKKIDTANEQKYLETKKAEGLATSNKGLISWAEAEAKKIGVII